IARHLTHLTSLSLAECKQVTDAGVRVIVNRLTHLQWLDLNGTAVGLSSELLQHSWNLPTIRHHYLREEQEGRRQLNEAKMLVVGAEAVGKTSLVKYLIYNEPCNPTEPKTPGIGILERISIAPWSVSESGTTGEPITLNVWDFGGQE